MQHFQCALIPLLLSLYGLSGLVWSGVLFEIRTNRFSFGNTWNLHSQRPRTVASPIQSRSGTEFQGIGNAFDVPLLARLFAMHRHVSLWVVARQRTGLRCSSSRAVGASAAEECRSIFASCAPDCRIFAQKKWKYQTEDGLLFYCVPNMSFNDSKCFLLVCFLGFFAKLSRL